MERVDARICCLDLDTFFVSVERLLDPSLVGKPVVVGAAPGKRGVVTSCSYEVRELGVRSGMSATEARRLAPHAVFVPPRHGVYSPYAKAVKEVLERFTPVVQTASIDEFFLDFHGCEGLYAQPGDTDADQAIERAVWQMRDAIQDEVGLPSSAGIAATRSIAKIASGRAKPAGVVMVRRGAEFDFVRELSVRKFPGIGPKAEQRLTADGIHGLGQLLSLPPGPLRNRYRRLSERVHASVFPAKRTRLGRDRPAFREHDPDGLSMGSISNERTFHVDVGDRDAVVAQLRSLVERVCWRVRKRDIRLRTVSLKLRYADFDTITRSITISPTHAEHEVLPAVLTLLDRAWTRPLALRLLGVQASNLVGPKKQLALPLGDAGRPAKGGAIDRVREQFGYDAIRVGAVANGRKSSWLA